MSFKNTQHLITIRRRDSNGNIFIIQRAFLPHEHIWTFW